MRLAVLAALCVTGVFPLAPAAAAGSPEPFTSWSALVDRQYIDLTGRSPSAAQRSAAVAALTNGTLTPGALVATIRVGDDHLKNVDPVTRLYRAFLLRIPDKGGLIFWINRRRTGTWTVTRIADSFATSNEFKTRYGKLSDLNFVKLIYNNVLERPYDPGGLEFWTRQLEQKRKSRGAVMANFSESNEYKTKQAAEVTVSVLHTFMLGTAPSKGAFDAAVTAIEGGQSIAEYATGLMATLEYRTRVASPLAISSNSLPDATVGQTYTTSLSALGGVRPYAWSASGLPDGLTIDAATGTISGVPIAPTSATLVANVTSAAGPSASKTLPLKVQAAPGVTISTPPLPSGDARFLDSLARDLLGRPPSDAEQAQWLRQLQGGSPRIALAATLASSDEFLDVVVEHLYASLLDRLPSGAERSEGTDRVRSTGSTGTVVASLASSAEFYALAGSTSSGYVNTLAQRLLHRDLWPDDAAPLVDELIDGSKTRLQVANEIYGGAESGRVRAKLWTQKLLSRDPTAAELDDWGPQVLGTGELPSIATIAGGDPYFDLAQTRVVEATLTTTPGTVVASGAQITSAVFAEGGGGTVVLAAGVMPPAVGYILVVDDSVNPSSGGIGRVVSLTRSPNGRTTLTLTAAGLADAFAQGEITDSTEVTDPVPDATNVGADTSADDPCAGMFATKVRANIGIDTRNDTRIAWSPNNYDVRIQAHVTPKLSVALQEVSLGGACKKTLWETRWDAPVQVGPITVPGYFKISSDLGISGQLSTLDLSTTLSMPCTVGVRATSSGVTNLTSCSGLRSTVTVTPNAEATLKAFADIKVGYFLGVDRGGWATANIGLTVGAELGVELRASTSRAPFWTLSGYLDLNLDLSGNLLGRWDLDFNLARSRLYETQLAGGARNVGTSSGGGVYRSNPLAGVRLGPAQSGTPFTGATAVATGGGHSCAVIVDGSATCWGEGYFGQLGNGSDGARHNPVPVSSLSEVASIAGGFQHTCALIRDGAVKCWGGNFAGELGTGTTSKHYVPAPVVGLSGATEIAANWYVSCALLTTGTVKCWGQNTYGELGDGTTTNRSTPVSVSGLNGVAHIAAGGSHTCAALTNGTVKCWGANFDGELGDGTKTHRPTPVTVTGLSGVKEIAAGSGTTCALLSNGTVKCWGLDWSGTALPSTKPVTVPSLTGVVDLQSSSSHTCALLASGSVRCWGRNTVGQLGDGTTIDRQYPVAVSGLGGVRSISTGGGHSCALLNDGLIRCWGGNTNGAIGDGTTINRPVPVPVLSG